MRTALLVLAAVACVWGPTLEAFQAPTMLTEVDCLDGNQRDLAGIRDATPAFPGDPIASNSRVLLAQGRQMIAHQVSTRERQYFEEETFLTNLLANELDETFQHEDIEGLLFVLTGQVQTGQPGVYAAAPPILRVYNATDLTDISTQSVLSEIDLTQTAGGPAVHMRVIPEDKKLLLIRPFSVTVWDYTDPTNLAEGAQVPLGDGVTGLLLGTCAQDNRRIGGLGSCVVQLDVDALGQPIKRAFFKVGILYDTLPEKLAKGGRAIVALEFGDGYHSGTFSWVFDPLESTCPVLAPTSAAEHATHDLALYHDDATSDWYLISVGEIHHGVRIFDITNFISSGFLPHATKTTWTASAFQADLLAVEVVDHSFPALAILGRHGFFAVKFDDMSNDEFFGELFGDGPRRDTLQMKEGPASAPQTKLWSSNGLGTDHRFKIVDVSKLLLRDPQAAPERYYAPGDSDTSVYIPEYGSVYCTNFHGLVRYDVSLAPDAIPDADSYLPAYDDTVVPPKLLPIEHMIAVKMDPPLDVYTWHLFGQTATGGFLHWGVNPQTYQPALFGFVDGKDANVWPASWASQGATYGQDVDFGVNPHSEHEIVVMDYYNFGLGEIAIAAYDLVTHAWGPSLAGPSELSPTPWDIELSEDGRWVFVGAEKGFFVAEITGGDGAMVVRSHVITDNGSAPGGAVGGHDFLQVRGIGHFSGLNDRVWVSMTDDSEARQNRFAFAVYDFDPMTGIVDPTPIFTLFDGAVVGMTDDFPDLYLTGGGRLRTWTHGNETQLFVCAGNGYVLQLSYFENGGSGEILTTGGQRHWHSGAFYSEISDCQLVNLAGPGLAPDLRLCASQWFETFAIAVPFPFQ